MGAAGGRAGQVDVSCVGRAVSVESCGRGMSGGRWALEAKEKSNCQTDGGLLRCRGTMVAPL